MKSQREQILEVLKRGDSLTKWDALHDLHIGNLGARIEELKKGRHDGIHYDIQTIMEPNADGNGKHARYRLIPPQVPTMPPAFPQKVENQSQSLFT